MSARSKTYADYVDMGMSSDLQFLDDAPNSVYEAVAWQCMFCGTVHHKSYRALQMRPHGCRCQNNVTFKENAYHSLAKRLEIEWLGDRPKNTKTLTQWRNPRTGAVVKASYANLAYGQIRKDLKEVLEIDDLVQSRL